jgi:hypothetical protein
MPRGIVEFPGAKLVVGDDGEIRVLLTPLHPFLVCAHASDDLLLTAVAPSNRLAGSRTRDRSMCPALAASLDSAVAPTRPRGAEYGLGQPSTAAQIRAKDDMTPQDGNC